MLKTKRPGNEERGGGYTVYRIFFPPAAGGVSVRTCVHAYVRAVIGRKSGGSVCTDLRHKTQIGSGLG